MSQPSTDADRSQRYPKHHRIRKRHEYLALQHGGKRRRAAHFTVVRGEVGRECTRLGITTSRKVGNAPQRNRIRRLVREFFRRNYLAIQPPCDLLVIARPGAAHLDHRAVQRELAQALRI